MEDEFPVLKYTVQLYYAPVENNNSEEIDNVAPVQVASGVLIKDISKHYLLTCKHVFDNIKIDDIVILTGSGFAVRLPNEVQFINDEKDSLDIALIQLSGYRLNELEDYYSFLPKQNLGLEHIFDEDLFYMLYGFVNKRTALKNRAYIVESFAYLTNIKQYKKIEKLGFSYDNNITLEYNRRKQSDFFDDTRQLGIRELKGLSGGGIWLSETGQIPDTFNYILVGIMIEERIDSGFVIGTKISLIKNSII